MTEIIVAIVPAIITSSLTLAGVWIQNSRHNAEVSELVEYRIKKLEEKQDKHNQLIDRMYALEKAEAIVEGKVQNLEARKDG